MWIKQVVGDIAVPEIMRGLRDYWILRDFGEILSFLVV